MSFASRDEAPHAAGAHRYWNESFYFNFFDDSTGWAGATRIGFSPNRGHADGFLCLYFPDKSAGFIRTWRALSEAMSPATEIAAPPFRYVMEEPYRSWSVHYEGPIFHFADPSMIADPARTNLAALPTKSIAIDLRFECLHEAYDFHASGKKRPLPARQIARRLRPRYLLAHAKSAVEAATSLPAMVDANHYEQACRFEGEITVDGVAHRVSGTGQRDHSWGVRDMRVPKRWRWFSCQFGDRLAINATRVEVLGLEVVGGYAYLDGHARGVTDWSLQVERWSDDGRWAHRAFLEMELETGERLSFDVEAETNLPVVVVTEGSCTVVNEARARFTWREGQRTNLGISEFMEQIEA